MSYQPYNRNAKSLVYFGDAGSDALLESSGNLTFDVNGNDLQIPDGGYIGSQSDYTAIRIGGDGNVTIARDLIVNGTTTTVNSTTVTIDDPIFTLGGDTAPSSDDGKDRGIEFRYYDGSAKVGFFGYDNDQSQFTLLTSATNASEVFSGTKGTLSANLAGNVTGDVTGDVTGNADTATALATARNFSIIGGVVAASDVSFNGTGDVDLTVTAASGLIMHNDTASIADSDFLVFADADDSHNLKKVTKANLAASFAAGSIDSLSDTTITSAGAGDLLIYNSSTSKWVNANLTAGTNIAITDADGSVTVGFTGTLAIANGGTNATTAAGARTNLGLAIGSDVQAYDADLSAIAALAKTDGNIIVGNGSTWVAENGSTARTSLGVAIGSDVQAHSDILDDLAGLTQASDALPYFNSASTADTTSLTAFGRSLIDDANAAAARTTLGVVIGTNVQAYDAGLASIAGLTTSANKMIYTTGSDTYDVADLSAFGRSLIDDADAATARGTLGVDAAGTDNSTPVTLNAAVSGVLSINGSQEISATDNGSDAVIGWDDSAGTIAYLSAADARAALNVDEAGTDNSTQVSLAGSYDYLTLVGQTITLGQIDLTTDVTGQVPVTNGGTGSSSAAGARTNLGLAIGSDVQAYHANLAAIAGFTPSDGYFIVGNGSAFVLENGSTVRASLGLTIGTDVQAYDAQLADVAGLSTTDGGFIVGNGSNFVIETGATARTSLGLGSLATLSSVGESQLASSAVTEVKRKRTVTATQITGSTHSITKDIVLCDASSNAINATLPSAIEGKRVTVKKTDSSTNAVTITGPTNGIDGATTKVLYHQYETITCVSDGTNWFII